MDAEEVMQDQDPLSIVGLMEVGIAESVAAQRNPDLPVMEPLPQARLTPLFEQPDTIVRDVLGDLSDSELAQYREECRTQSSLSYKRDKSQQQDSTGPNIGELQKKCFDRFEASTQPCQPYNSPILMSNAKAQAARPTTKPDKSDET